VDGSDPNSPHEAALLSLYIEKAGALLGWYPSWGFKEAIQRTISWYHERHVAKNPDMLGFSNRQIDDYVQAARRKDWPWSR